MFDMPSASFNTELLIREVKKDAEGGMTGRNRRVRGLIC